ncbi:MAG: RtcB family protein [Clostridia bacterium]|jgi:tRNA-splicing ligase RtcB
MNVISDANLPIFMYCDNPEEGAIAQAKNVANHPAVRNYVAVMPDTHEGYGMPIGGVCALEDAVSPNMVGVVIGCGMLSINTQTDISSYDEKTLKDKLTKVTHSIRREVPMGFGKRCLLDSMKKYGSLLDTFKEELRNIDFSQLFLIDNYLTKENIAIEGLKQIGTLGGGNHFIELQKDEKNILHIMIHSGSRNIGKRICYIFNKIAKEYCEKFYSSLPSKDLSFLPISIFEGRSYVALMKFCEYFAFTNREAIGNIVYSQLSREFELSTEFNEADINVHHNYASLEHFGNKDYWIHRKGAIRVRKDELGIIPGSMGTTSYIVKGKGEEKSWNSCSHGAGRNMSRKKAKEVFSVDVFKEKMKGVVVFKCDAEHLDESPMAYKDIDEVMEQQKDLVEIVKKLTPLAVEKA